MWTFSGCVSLKSLCVPSSAESVDRDSFGTAVLISRLTFATPSRVRELVALPAELTEVPDSVQRVHVGIDCGNGRQTLNFGHESKLDRITIERRIPERSVRCFARFSTRSLKLFRSRQEF
jgi:hypothetical protein